MESATRTCITCFTEKPIAEFAVSTTQGRAYRRRTCKRCMRDYWKDWQKCKRCKIVRPKKNPILSQVILIARLELMLERERELNRQLQCQLQAERKRNQNLYAWHG